MPHEARLQALGLSLPQVPARGGLYEHAVRSGPWLYLSGKGPRQADGSRPTGRVGTDFTVHEAQAHARQAGLNLLAALRQELGTLDRVSRIVKLFGMVNCDPGFAQQSEVIDGCSALMLDVFGPQCGAHARSAIGVAALPGNMTVEIELVVEVAP